jgi:protein arginine kinase activator
MQCEHCKDNKATVHVQQARDGEVKDLYLCQECARKTGLKIDSPMALTDFLFGMEVHQKDDSVSSEAACQHCRMTWKEFQKTSRLGCAKCYDAFSAELEPLLADWHRDRRHVGKVPKKDKIAAGLALAQRELDAAVMAQNFETAAGLRDEIQSLRAMQNRSKKSSSKIEH